jgi:N-acetylglutamate synthase-like GNAT family acetyltransferase
METRPDLSPWLASVYVPLKFRGRGIGTNLCSRVVSEATLMGYLTVYLFTPNRETFYAYQGWKVLERTIYRDKEATVMLIKPGQILR